MSYFGIPIRNGIGIGLRSYVGLESKAPAWTPSVINTSLWLDANDPNTITLNGSTVSQWNDKSGNGRNAVQATAGYQPTYSTAVLNGKNVLTWPSTANGRSLNTSASVPLMDFYAVIRYGDGTNTAWVTSNQGVFGAANSGYLGLVGNNVGDPFWYQFSEYPNLRRNGGTATTLGSIVTALPLPPAIIESWRTTTLTAPLAIGMDRAYTALNRGWSGVIAEIICLDSVASTDTRQRIEGYLAWKWGGF